jgi:tetratricopeptide (TPR) repeat protein
MLATVSLAQLATGCSSTQKFAGLPKAPGIPQQQMAGSSTPGSADFSINEKPANQIKLQLAYAAWNEQDGNLLEARGAYDKVLEKNPKNIDALMGLSRLDIRLNRMTDAEAKLEKAQKLAPKNPQVAAAFAHYHASRQDWSHAIEQIQTARTLSPYDPAFPFQLGVYQAKSGDVNAALGSFTEAVGKGEAHYNLAVLLQEQGRKSDAEYHLQQAVANKPDLPQAHRLLASIRQPHENNAPGSPAGSSGNASPRGNEQTIIPAGYSPQSSSQR